MRYSVDDLHIDTALKALSENQFGTDIVFDATETIAHVTIYSGIDNDENPVGYQVGSLSRNTGTFPSFTLVLEEHLNDRERMAAVFTNILRRKSMR